jgi:predicted aldo/keto reductase-like oxidoreductase
MDTDVKSALVEFQQEIERILDKEIEDLTTELEVADIELLHGKLTENGQ